MSDAIAFTIDGKEVTARPGQTILEAAQQSGVYIPRLCYHEDLTPYGSCRVCVVKVNGRTQSSCTQPVTPGMIVESEVDEIRNIRKAIIEMLFVEGNHFCPFCEKSGDCELQALGYRFGIAAPRFPYMFPRREVDATHRDVLLERNRCVLCARCVRASSERDGRHVFDFVGRGAERRIAVDAESGLGGTDLDVRDKAVEVCPVGAILPKRVGFAVPVGERTYDSIPIGSQVSEKAADSK